MRRKAKILHFCNFRLVRDEQIRSRTPLSLHGQWQCLGQKCHFWVWSFKHGCISQANLLLLTHLCLGPCMHTQHLSVGSIRFKLLNVHVSFFVVGSGFGIHWALTCSQGFPHVFNHQCPWERNHTTIRHKSCHLCQQGHWSIIQWWQCLIIFFLVMLVLGFIKLSWNEMSVCEHTTKDYVFEHPHSFAWEIEFAFLSSAIVWRTLDSLGRSVCFQTNAQSKRDEPSTEALGFVTVLLKEREVQLPCVLCGCPTGALNLCDLPIETSGVSEVWGEGEEFTCFSPRKSSFWQCPLRFPNTISQQS